VNKVVVAERELQRRYYYKEKAYYHEIYKKQPKTRSNQKLQYVLRLAVIALLLFTVLYRFSVITEYQYKIEKLKSEIEEINVQNERLKVEIASLKSVARIENIAINKLNMKEPDKQQIIYIDPK